MSAVETFEFGNFHVRALVIDGDPWFVATDVRDGIGRELAESDAHESRREERMRRTTTP